MVDLPGPLPSAEPTRSKKTTRTISGGRRIVSYSAPAGPSHYHRVDGPARIGFFSDGCVEYEEWWLHGAIHRVGGPAVTTYFHNEKVISESYYIGGHGSRLDGPADIAYDADGSITQETWMLGGVAMNGPADIPNWVGDLQVQNADFVDLVRGSAFGEFLDQGNEPEEIRKILRAGVVTVDGVREVFSGAPIEWVRSFEAGRR